MAVKMITKFKNFFNKFLKKKKPFVRFYSLEPGVVAVFPITPSARIKRNYLSFPDPTDAIPVRNCPGIRKLTSTGWVVTAPADFIIRVKEGQIGFEWREPWRFNTAPAVPGMDRYISAQHGPSQTVPLIDDLDKTLSSIVKVETPWRVEASDDTMLLLLPFVYNNEKRFTAATGFLDPRYGYNINIQLFWHVLDGETLVRAGTPLCQIIPVSRKQLSLSAYDVKIEDATEEDKIKERAFIYASNCVIMKHDKLSSRLDRSMKVLDNYTKKDQR